MSTVPAIPPLFLSPAEWVGLKRKLSDPFFARLAKTNAQGMSLLEATREKSLIDIPKDLVDPASLRHPNGGTYRAIKVRLLRAAIALHACEDPSAWAFASETIDFLLQRDYWRIEALGCRIRHFDLKLGDLIYCACFALNAFEQQLDLPRKNKLIAILIEEGLGAYLRGWDAHDWWKAAEFNWATATHGNAGLGALAIAAIDPDLSAKVMARARDGLQVVIDYLPQDGWWSEGAMYHTTTLAHFSDFVIPLYRITGDDLGLSKNPRWIEALENRPYCLAPDGKILNFSNCPVQTDEWFLPQIYWWAEHLHRPEWTTFEDSICKSWTYAAGVFHDVEAFLYRPANPQLPSLPLAPLRHFRGLDWLTWRGATTWLAFRSGNNGGNHNNMDLGHFIFGRGQTRYLLDPGYGPARTAQHNAVTIHGKDQTEASVAVIVHHGELPGGFFLCCDLSACYPYVLEYHFRYLILLGDAHLFVIDHLRAKKRKRVGAKFHFQTGLAVTPGKNGCRIGAQGDDVELASLTGHDAPVLTPWKGPYADLTEISFNSEADLPDELSAFRVSFDGSSAPTLRVDEAGQTLAISWKDEEVRVNLKDRTVNHP